MTEEQHLWASTLAAQRQCCKSAPIRYPNRQDSNRAPGGITPPILMAVGKAQRMLGLLSLVPLCVLVAVVGRPRSPCGRMVGTWQAQGSPQIACRPFA